MYAGGSDLHKNLNMLYSAFSKLPKNILSSHQLVMVGEGLKHEEKTHRRKLKKIGINDNVVFTGHVRGRRIGNAVQFVRSYLFFLQSTKALGFHRLKPWRAGLQYWLQIHQAFLK